MFLRNHHGWASQFSLHTRDNQLNSHQHGHARRESCYLHRGVGAWSRLNWTCIGLKDYAQGLTLRRRITPQCPSKRIPPALQHHSPPPRDRTWIQSISGDCARGLFQHRPPFRLLDCSITISGPPSTTRSTAWSSIWPLPISCCCIGFTDRLMY